MKTPQQYINEVKMSVQEITVDDLSVITSQPDIVLIDVREHEEYVQGHIPGSVNYPRGVLEVKLTDHPAVSHHLEVSDALNDFASRDVYLICRSGGRSALAAKSLMLMGHPSVYSVEGGMNAWIAKGYSVIK